MNRFSIKPILLLSILAVAIASLTSILILQTIKAQATEPYYAIEPVTVTKGPAPVVNQTFTITAWLRNVTADNTPTGAAGVDILITWNASLLQNVSRQIMVGQIGGALNPPPFIAVDKFGTYGNGTDYYHLAAASIDPEVPWWGDGKVVEITFKVIYQPSWWWERKASTPLKIASSELVEWGSGMFPEQVPHTRVSGYYEVLSQSIVSPTSIIKVEPSSITKGPNQAINDTFTVDVNLYDIKNTSSSVPAGLYGVEINLEWNSTLLEMVSATSLLGNTIAGGVLNPSIFQQSQNFTSGAGGLKTYQLFGTSVEPAPAWWGNGTIATLTFKVIKQPVEPNPSLSTALNLYNTALVMTPYPFFAQEIPHTASDGNYQILPFPQVTTYSVVWGSTTYYVGIKSDSLIIAPPNLDFDPTAKAIGFSVAQADGYANVTIPKSLMWVNNLAEWVVKVDDIPSAFTPTENATHYFLYFTFAAGNHVITIQSTNAVPEFNTILIPAILIIALMIVIVGKIIYSKRRGSPVVAIPNNT